VSQLWDITEPGMDIEEVGVGHYPHSDRTLLVATMDSSMTCSQARTWGRFVLNAAICYMSE